MSGVLRGFPAAAYRGTPSCPALRGPQTLACPAIALFRAIFYKQRRIPFENMPLKIVIKGIRFLADILLKAEGYSDHKNISRFR